MARTDTHAAAQNPPSSRAPNVEPTENVIPVPPTSERGRSAATGESGEG